MGKSLVSCFLTHGVVVVHTARFRSFRMITITAKRQ